MGSTRPLFAPPSARSAVAEQEIAVVRAPVPAGRTRARLNLFQRTMLRWRELHPYSAAHAVRIEGPLEPARLRDLIAERLADLGLTGLILDPSRRRLRAGGEDAETPELRVVPGEDDPRAAVWREFEAQLNRPFPSAGRLCAFRFFAVPAGDAFYLGLVYDHFIAAGDAIALLLQNIVAGYSHAEASRPAMPARLASPRYRRLLLHHPLSVIWAMLRLPRLIARARRAVRPPRLPDRDPYNGLAALTFGRDEVAQLRRAATAWAVTLNDILLAALLAAVAPLAPERATARRRRELAVASIVSIRRDLPAHAADAFVPRLVSRLPHRSGRHQPGSARAERARRIGPHPARTAVSATARRAGGERRHVAVPVARPARTLLPEISSGLGRRIDAERQCSLG